MENSSRFNKEDILNNIIKEKVQELKNLCQEHQIPMFISMCYKNTPKDSFYYNDVVGSKSNNINLTNDLFKHYVNINNGFTTIPKSTKLSISYDDFDDGIFDDKDKE